MASSPSIALYHQRHIEDIKDYEAGKRLTRSIHKEQHDGYDYYRFDAADWPMRYADGGLTQVKYDPDSGDLIYISTHDNSTKKVVRAPIRSASIGHRMSRIAGVDREKWIKSANERLAII